VPSQAVRAVPTAWEPQRGVEIGGCRKHRGAGGSSTKHQASQLVAHIASIIYTLPGTLLLLPHLHSTLTLLEHLMRPTSLPPTLLSASLRRSCQRPRRASPSTAAPRHRRDPSLRSLSQIKNLQTTHLRAVDISRVEGVQVASHL
jgi:hypothetical protein